MQTISTYYLACIALCSISCAHGAQNTRLDATENTPQVNARNAALAIQEHAATVSRTPSPSANHHCFGQHEDAFPELSTENSAHEQDPYAPCP